MNNSPITTQDFLDLLPIVADRGWRKVHQGYIRDSDNRCPLCALAHELSLGEIDLTSVGFTAMQHVLGLAELSNQDYYAIAPIFYAADDPYHELRPALIEALGGIK